MLTAFEFKEPKKFNKESGNGEVTPHLLTDVAWQETPSDVVNTGARQSMSYADRAKWLKERAYQV